jgi:indole-3-glycerol phosphate synthase
VGDVLDAILARKRREVARRRRRRERFADPPRRVPLALDRLRREDRLRVLAEVKFRSPSAGPIRSRRPGEGVRVARGYAAAGVDGISVLADGPGFGGSVLEVRRVARAVAGVPVLFKEFVLDEVQLDAAAHAGAALVLLLVRALPRDALPRLIAASRRRGLVPLVEAANRAEVDRALEAGARVVGVNARDLATFRVDFDAAQRALESVPKDRVALHLSGVVSAETFARVAAGRADGVLVGSALMASPDPGATLAAWREAAS